MNEVVYGRFDTPLGRMVAGETQRGCCLLEFEDRGGLERIKSRILKRHGARMVEGRGAVIDRIQIEMKEYFDGNRRQFSFPLDLKGTPFQKAVWRELLGIPCGGTRTYGEIALAIGRPKAVRAVGRANGANYISIAVPCHRVIERGGGLRGYGGGLWRKRRLLEHESSMRSAEAADVGSRPGADDAAKRFAPEGLHGSLDLFDSQPAPSEQT